LNFTVLPKLAESLFIEGSGDITDKMQYSATVLPDYTTNKAVQWSISDGSVATIDQNGFLSPLKNGVVTITAKTTDGSNLSCQKIVTINGVKAKINQITLNTGYWNAPFDPQVLDYTIYVSKNVSSVNFTLNFTGGTVICGTYGLFFNNVAKTISINQTSQTFEFVRSNVTDCLNATYHITILKSEDFVTEGTTLTKYIGSGTELTIPNTITEINDDAFSNIAITKITIPNTVTQLATNAFRGCNHLVIYCNTNSAAHRFAQTNSIPFVLTDAVTVLLGDANKDGTISAYDAVVQLALIAGTLPADDVGKTASDINGDGTITAYDAVLLLQYVAGIETGFDIGKSINVIPL